MMREHGSYSIERKNRVVCVDATGPWNAETIRHYQEDMIATIAEGALTGASWGMVFVLHGEPVHTPETEAMQIESMRAHMSQGRRATAFVLDPEIQAPGFLKSMYERIYRGVEMPHAYFDTLEDAQAWVEAELRD